MKQLHQAESVSASRVGRLFALAAVTWMCAACSDDSGSTSSNGGGGSGGSSNQTDSGVDPAVLSACPNASTLIETTDWPGCLSGKRLVGTEPFSGDSCELAIGPDSTFEYSVDGQAVLSVPASGEWTDASGTYINDGEGSRLIFLASISPDLPVVEGEPRVTSVGISIFGLASEEDKVEVTYLDAELARKTHNCTLTGP